MDGLLEFGNSVIRTSWKGTAMLEEGRWDNAHVVAKRVSESDEKEKALAVRLVRCSLMLHRFEG